MTGKIDTYNLWCRLSFIMLSIWINILGIISVVSFLVMLISNWTTPQWMNYCEEIMRTVTGSWHNRSVLTIVFKTQRWCFIQTIPGKALGTHVVRITSQTIVYACCKYTSFWLNTTWYDLPTQFPVGISGNVTNGHVVIRYRISKYLYSVNRDTDPFTRSYDDVWYAMRYWHGTNWGSLYASNIIILRWHLSLYVTFNFR